MKKNNYNTDNISQMSGLDHIRLRPSLYIGDCNNPTHLLVEVLDNAIDEAQAGFCNRLLVSIDTITKEFTIADDGRGLPFDYKLPLLEDPPILICNSIFTSGKYKKNEIDSAYKVSSGLHGIGITAVNALSEYMNIDVFRDGKHASYEFKYKEAPVRNPLKSKANPKLSTIIKVKPHKDHFDSLDITQSVIKERLIIAAASLPDIHIAFKVDDNVEIIKGSEINLIETYLGKDVKDWHTFDSVNTEKEKSNESCHVKIGWDFNNPSTKMEVFTTVNFVKVQSGAHINKLTSILENCFQKLAKKNNFEFNPSDVLNWLRIYVDLKVVDIEFESQTKEKLSKKTDLNVMKSLETKIENYFKKLPDINFILEKFEFYRKSIQNKKINKSTTSNKRGSAQFTKLRDCVNTGGELFICEGESAGGGLIKARNPKTQAVLPLTGVVLNATKKSMTDILKNDVIGDLIKAIGCGITPHCDITKLRYKKIIIAADADPAGDFITALLITLFAKLTPEIIKSKSLYICKTPLFGHGFKQKFQPLWTDQEVADARKNNIKVRRFKGLGEYEHEEIKVFTLEEKTRRLELIEWDDEIYKKLINVMKNTKLRKDLVLDLYQY